MEKINFKVLTKEEERKFSSQNLKFYKMSSFNESIAYYIDGENLLVNPNVPAAEHSIIINISDFESNKFPLLSENDTPYYRNRELMTSEGFTKKNVLKIFDVLNFNYQEDTFYNDAENFVKMLSLDEKIKMFIPMLFFIGEDLHKLCPDAEWQFNTLYYFHPFSEADLYYKKFDFSFYDLNLLLEGKLLNNKNIKFKEIYNRIEKKFNKEKSLWNYTIEPIRGDIN